jgi:hypothetical protein
MNSSASGLHVGESEGACRESGGGWTDYFSVSQPKLVLNGGAAVCWSIWKVRNDACFNRFPDDPATVIYKARNMIEWWANVVEKPR